MICITDTLFNDSSQCLNLLPDMHSVFQAERDSRACNLSGAGDVFIAVKIVLLLVSNAD